MRRKVTAEERTILLENPELVMFEPYSAMKVHRASLGKSLIMPALTGIVFFLWGFLCPDFINEHPTVFAAVGCIALVLASGFLPVLYFVLDDRNFKKAKEQHYSQQLKMLLPLDLECDVALIRYVVYEKAEGGWILDGKEEPFGYCGCVNFFRFEPQTEVAVIFGEKFYAYIKRDPKTESFYC